LRPPLRTAPSPHAGKGVKFDQEAAGLGAPPSPPAGLAAPPSPPAGLAIAPPGSLAAAAGALAADSGAGVSSDFWHAVAAKNTGTRAKIRNLRITSSFFFRARQKRIVLPILEYVTL